MVLIAWLLKQRMFHDVFMAFLLVQNLFYVGLFMCSSHSFYLKYVYHYANSSLKVLLPLVLQLTEAENKAAHFSISYQQKYPQFFEKKFRYWAFQRLNLGEKNGELLVMHDCHLVAVSDIPIIWYIRWKVFQGAFIQLILFPNIT